MSTQPSIPESSLDDFPQELLDLGKIIQDLPNPHKVPLLNSYAQVIECVRRRRRILNLVQESLSQLRLDIKYLMFDLEATRKERDQLKSQLEDFE